MQASKKIKAVGLMSGGLDSCLAVKVIKDLGVDVHAVYFVMPWFYGKGSRAEGLARALDVHFKIFQLDEDYIEVLKAPRHGYGAAFNPCVDCHIYMIKKAAEYMKTIGAEFVFTGEVIGQRPMSQRKDCLSLIDRRTGLDGRLLRPLSAKLLAPTRPEQEGLIDREKLLDISGRGRREQIDLAEKLGIQGYSPPGGGCLLTEKYFSFRIKDMLTHGYRDFKDIAVLRWGRYFRINENFCAIVGRDEKENDYLMEHGNPEDIILDFMKLPGPVILLKGKDPSFRVLALAAGLGKRFSKFRKEKGLDLQYYRAGDKDNVGTVLAQDLSEEQINAMDVSLKKG